MYDRDGSGEIDPEEMEDIFKKLCKIAAGIESDQNKIKAKVGHRTVLVILIPRDFIKGDTGRETEGAKRKRQAGRGEGQSSGGSEAGSKGAQYLLQVRCKNQISFEREIDYI